MEIKQPLGGNKMHYLSPINLFFSPCLLESPSSRTGVGGSATLLKSKGTCQAPLVNLALIHPFVRSNINGR